MRETTRKHLLNACFLAMKMHVRASTWMLAASVYEQGLLHMAREAAMNFP
jgi:hypothetical protein